MSAAAALEAGDRFEVARFWEHVVKGPRPLDCWVWTGAIADDGYGRFSIRREGVERIVRPNRYALALALGRPLSEDELSLHRVCDMPICVRAFDDDGHPAHLVAGTQAQNLADMARKGRGGGRGWPHRWYGPDRVGRYERSKALREAVRDGWDNKRVDDVLSAAGDQFLLW